MGWVVKQWRLDAIEELLADAARADLAAARASAERDARRARRVAHRTAAEADEQLLALERLGVELRAHVRDWQAWRQLPESVEALVPVEPVPPLPAPAPVGALEPPAGVTPPAPPQRRRPARASMHSSALTELFRATSPP
jgi:hypothetical protein